MEQNDLNREKVYTKFKLKNGNCKVRIAGISMEPFLHNGQYIIAATANDYNVDENYRKYGILITDEEKNKNNIQFPSGTLLCYNLFFGNIVKLSYRWKK